MSEQEFPIQGSLSLQPIKELEHPLMLKDRWHGEKDLGMRINKHLGKLTVYFGDINQTWLKDNAKKFILYCRTQGKSFGTLQQYSQGIRQFAQFLETECVYSFDDITDETFSRYFASLELFAPKTINNRLSIVKAFLNTGTMNSWFDVSTYWFNDKIPRIKPQIDYIPYEVLEQLDINIHLLPKQLQRMIILFRTLGLRASEIFQMRFDCLRQRKNGQWEIYFTNWKFNEQEDILPILKEIAVVIQEQQNYIKANLNEEFDYLFGGYTSHNKPEAKIMSLSKFNKRLNKLVDICDIKDKTGKKWHFTSHQFRRTVATKMTNEGVRQYIIQRYLRHDNPDMMQHYANILPETEKREINQLYKQKKIVDVTGQEVSINHPELDNDIGLQWLRSKMQPKALAMGFCARPQLLKPCPHVNACMSCEHLRLDEGDLPALKQHLERNEKLKQESEQKGYFRQLQGIKEDTAKLINLVNTLENKNG